MEGEPSAKRPRAEESEHDSLEPITHHQQYWFEDGNVILQANSTQFRVHRSVLSSQSQIFKDMFSIPQPTSSSLVDFGSQSSPIVVLHDTPEDIENLLSLLYDTMRVHNFREKMSISVLGTMLRMGRKYRFKHLRAEALHCLKSEFPATLAEWDARRHFQHIKEENTTLFDALYLAHENSVKSILPGICVLIGRWNSNKNIRESFALLAEKKILKTEEPLAFFLGRDKLFSAFSWKVSRFQEKIPSDECTKRRACTSAANDLFKYVLSYGIHGTFEAALCQDFSAYPKDKFCPDCDQVRKDYFNPARKELWDALPKYFGLDDVIWEELSDDEDADGR